MPKAVAPRQAMLARERPRNLRDQGAAQVELWQSKADGKLGITWEGLGGTAILAALVAITFVPAAVELGWPLVLALVAMVGIGFPLLLSYLGSWLNRSAARRHLASFQRDYHVALRGLGSSGLALLIAEDDVWQCLFDTGVAPATRLVVQPPRTAAERLIYGTLCWDLLLAYRSGQRTGFDMEVLARQPALRLWLGEERLGEMTSMLALARFCAIYDFFEASAA